MAIGICKCGRSCVKHDSGTSTFRWLCEDCRKRISKEVSESNKSKLKNIFDRVLKRSA